MRRVRPAGDFDYEKGTDAYPSVRKADPRIEKLVQAALGDARTVVNVGAGAGSYEPTDRYVVAVEPSATMRARRIAPLVPAVDATAEHLPFDDRSFDAAMATMTVHQWENFEQGLRELRRVARGPVVILTFDPSAMGQFWLADYVPELMDIEARRFPPIDEISAVLGGSVTVSRVPVPIDCTDGFMEAFYARPERFLDESVRRSQSGWAAFGSEVERRAVKALADDLATGEWTRKYGQFSSISTFDGSLRLITGVPDDASR